MAGMEERVGEENTAHKNKMKHLSGIVPAMDVQTGEREDGNT